jgi:uncharacterized protein YkwD
LGRPNLIRALLVDEFSCWVQLATAMLGAMLSKSLLPIMGLGMGLALLAGAASAQPYPYPPPVQLAPPPSMAPAPCGNGAFAQEAEALIAEGISAERTKFAPGAPPLMPDIDLTRIAQRRSCDMARGTSDFSHTDAQGNFIAGYMVRARFGPYGSVGENIMEMGGTVQMGRLPFSVEQFAREAVEGWMESPGHRKNILNPRYNSSGIGVAMVGGQAIATQVFRGPPHVRDQE